jgi:osmotically inducible protein OsmC
VVVATRNGSAEWKGDLKGGTGALEVGDGVFRGDYSFESRFEEGDGTNPEELIAGAHAACFSMALSGILAEAGHTAESIRTRAAVHLGPGVIKRIDLTTEASVPGIDEDAFKQHAEEAKAGCPVSKALAGVGEITVAAELVS